jgi:hypothetical protein
LSFGSATTDLESIRDQQAVTSLPEGEREGWRMLWAEVDPLLKKLREAAKQPKGAVTK